MKRFCLFLSLCMAMLSFSCKKAVVGERSDTSEGQRYPTPTEIASGHDERELHNRRREEWIEKLHRTDEDTDWRQIERQNWQSHLEVRNMQNAFPFLAADVLAAGSWSEVGSSNLAGRTHHTVLDTAGMHIYVGSNLGGVWRGDFNPSQPDLNNLNWTPLSDGIYGGAWQLAVLTGPPLTILKSFKDEIHRSVDGGNTWSLSNGLTGEVKRILKVNDTQETLFVITKPNFWNQIPNKILRSQDDGATFQEIRDLGTYRGDIWTSRTAEGPLYLLTDNRLEMSTDLGQTWSVLGSLPWTGDSIVTLTGSEASGPTFYAAVQLVSGGTRPLFRSQNGGITWTQGSAITDFWGDLTSLAASTVDPDLVLYGGVELYRSIDGGQTFQVINYWYEYYSDPANKLHADIPGIDFVPLSGGGELLFIGTDGGTYFSNDGGATVQNISLDGLRISQYYSTLTDATDPSRILAGSQDQGYQESLDIALGAFDQLISGDYGQLTSSDGSHSMVYSVYPGFVLVSETDTGGTWLTCCGITFPPSETYAWLPGILADPLDLDSFYFPARYLYKYTRSAPGSSTWNQTQLPFSFETDFNEHVSALAISPSDTNSWYVGTTNGRFWYSTNGGNNWSLSTFTNLPRPHYLYSVANITDPQDSTKVTFGGSGYSNPAVYRSVDGGQTFAPLGSNQPQTVVFGLALDPRGLDHIYAATESGPYMYDASTDSWSSILSGPAPLTSYWSVETLSDRIRFGTYGRGIWDYIFAVPTLSVTKVGSGSGTVTSNPVGIDCGSACSHSYTYGTTVTLTATPAGGSTFAGWSGACSGTGSCVVSMTANRSVTATFNGSGPIIQISSPSGGESWTAGSTHTITWTSSGLDPSGRIYLFYEDGGWQQFADVAPSATSYNWTLPSAAIGATWLWVGNWVNGAWEAYDTSNFSIVASSSDTADFYTVNPCRAIDTRNPDGPLAGPALVAGADRTFTIAGTCGIPSTAKAVSVNITVTQPTNRGNVRLHPGGTAVPQTSTINYPAGQTRANNAIVSLDALGELAVFVGQVSGTVHFILDVNGYFQ